MLGRKAIQSATCLDEIWQRTTLAKNPPATQYFYSTDDRVGIQYFIALHVDGADALETESKRALGGLCRLLDLRLMQTDTLSSLIPASMVTECPSTKSCSDEREGSAKTVGRATCWTASYPHQQGRAGSQDFDFSLILVKPPAFGWT